MSRLYFVRLLLTCAVLFLVLQRLYVWVRSNHEVFLNDRLNGVPSVWLINQLAPDENVVAADGRLVNGRGGDVNIKKGCEGFEVAILLVSVLAVYPMAWRRRLLGILLGVLLIYGLNIIRIVSLYYLWSYHPRVFELFHLTVWQAIIILLAWLFFIVWIDRAGNAAAVPLPEPEPEQEAPHDA